MNIGKSIAYFRRQRGLTQEKLAEKMGVQRRSLTRMEASDDIIVQNLKKVCDALEVPIQIMYIHAITNSDFYNPTTANMYELYRDRITLYIHRVLRFRSKRSDDRDLLFHKAYRFVELEHSLPTKTNHYIAIDNEHNRVVAYFDLIEKKFYSNYNKKRELNNLVFWLDA